jgi:trypsin-like peptidase
MRRLIAFLAAVIAWPVIALPVIALPFILSPASAQAEPSAETMRQAARSLVKISASDCNGPGKQGTGFVWQKSTRIVTALHVVAGCRQISSWNQDTRKTTALRVTHQLADADLALLDVVNDHNWPPLQSARQQVAVNEVLKALGYSYGVNSWHDMDLKKSAGDSTLRKAIPAESWQQLQQAGLMDANTRIIRTQGHLLPGMSGAPVINDSGQVVGVGDGGLEKGAASISWVMPARYLADLLKAGNRSNINTSNLTVAFAADVGFENARVIQCGDMRLRKTRTRPFAALASQADDQFGIRYVVDAARIDPTPFQFDIYESERNGGVVAVPKGMIISEGGFFCTGRHPSMGVGIVLSGSHGRNIHEINNISLQFEQTLIDHGDYFFQFDPTSSYVRPTQRPDGLVANRKAAYGISKFTGQPESYMVETLITKRGEFLGVVAYNEEFTPPQMAWCNQSPYHPNCGPRYRDLVFAWSHAVLGVMLSTFPWQN